MPGTGSQEQSSSTAENTADETTEDDDDDASQSSAQPSGRSKTDDDVRQVSREEAEAYAKECGLLFFEASAKTGANVGEVFTEIGDYLFHKSSIAADLLAKTIPLDAATPKPAGNASRNAGAAQPQERVNLDQGAQAKKGGCC